jgi:uncharacterized protein
MPSSDVAFSESVKRIQTERGSRAIYARVEAHGGFETDVTDDLRAFLADTDTAFLATASADGQPYVQHRGGPKGFIRAIDEHTIGWTELAGNRQYVTAGNLADNDRVCLFLMDYAHRRRVKVWGTARVVDGQFTIAVRAWDVNCPKHIPQKIDATDVEKLVARITELEAENRALKAASV